jgi:hypothetical protein
MRVDLPTAKMMAPTRELFLPVIEIIEVCFFTARQRSGYQKVADCDPKRKSIHNTVGVSIWRRPNSQMMKPRLTGVIRSM